MKKRAALIALVLGVDALAVAATASLPATGLAQQVVPLAILLTLAAMVGTRAVHIPRLRIQLTAADAFIFLAMLALSPVAVPLAAFAGTFGAAVGGARDSSLVKSAFNLGAVPLSAAAATWIFLAVAGPERTTLAQAAGGLCAAVAAFLAVNLCLVGLAMTLERRVRFLDVLRASAFCGFNSTVCSMLVGAALAFMIEGTGPIGYLLAVPATLAILSGFHALRHQIERERPTADAPPTADTPPSPKLPAESEPLVPVGSR